MIEAVKFGEIHAINDHADVDNIIYKEKELQITIATKTLETGDRLGYRIVFSYTTSFRCLDEGDLARYWASEKFSFGYHVVKVLKGGWSDEEELIQGYKNPRTEWMIVTGNDCVSVFSAREPMIEQVILPPLDDQ